MAGLRKEQKFRALERLYIRRGIQYDINKIHELSTSQLAKEIIKVREYQV